MPNNLCQIEDASRSEVMLNNLTYLEHQSFVWHRHSQSLTHVVVQNEPRIASISSGSMRCARSLPSFHQWDMLSYRERCRSKGKTPPCSLSLRKPPREHYHWFACCHARTPTAKCLETDRSTTRRRTHKEVQIPTQITEESSDQSSQMDDMRRLILFEE